MSDVPVEPGTVGERIGGYELLELVGKGGCGWVYRGVNGVGHEAAVKLLLPKFHHDPDVISRFFEEARIVNELRHAHVVTTFDYVQSGPPTRFAVIMELLDGRPLSDVIADDGPLELAAAVGVCLEIVSAVRAAHAIGVVHRDLKPGNIMVTSTGAAKILDFGIAQIRGRPVAHETATGAFLGSPRYMAPEQLGASKDVTAAADVYAVAEILFEALTGRSLFAGTLGEIVAQKTVGTIPTLDLPSSVPNAAKVEALVQSCLRLDPAQRPDMAALQRDLEGLLEAPSSTKPEIELDDHQQPHTGPRHRAWMVAAASTLALAFLVVWYVQRHWSATPDTTTTTTTVVDSQSQLTRVRLAVRADGRAIESGTALKSGTGFEVHIELAQPALLHVFHVGPKNVVTLLHPPVDAVSRPWAGTLRLPPDEGAELELDETPGTERLFVFAERDRTDALARLATSARRGGFDVSRVQALFDARAAMTTSEGGWWQSSASPAASFTIDHR